MEQEPGDLSRKRPPPARQSRVARISPAADTAAPGDPPVGLSAHIEPVWILTQGNGERVDARLLPLLEAVAATGSLQQAARRVGLSYRHAWTLAKPWTADGGLLRLLRGHGAALTEAGAQLVENAEKARVRWRKEASRWQDLELRLNAAHSEKIKLCASYDLLLADVLPLLAARQGVTVEIVFRDSVEALAALKAGQCDVAGFHAPVDPAHPLHRHMMALLLETPGAAGRILFRRIQGLIVERDNPHGIRTLADLVRLRMCFVNRQRGSGTRLLFDALLADHNLAAADIIGYGHEEFTHAAVAATVASGVAQAGFGNEAAAKLFDLSFIPVIEEHYFLGWREQGAAQGALSSLLDSREWQQRVRDMPGYANEEADVGARRFL